MSSMMSLSFYFYYIVFWEGPLYVCMANGKIMAENFRQWKMQQYEKYQKGRKAVQPKKEDLHLRDGVHSET